MWRVVAERSSSLDPSSSVVGRVWVRIPVMTLAPLIKALNHSCFVKVRKAVHSALPAKALVDDTHAFNLKAQVCTRNVQFANFIGKVN